MANDKPSPVTDNKEQAEIEHQNSCSRCGKSCGESEFREVLCRDCFTRKHAPSMETQREIHNRFLLSESEKWERRNWDKYHKDEV